MGDRCAVRPGGKRHPLKETCPRRDSTSRQPPISWGQARTDGSRRWCATSGVLLAHYEGDAVAAMTLLEEATALAREGQYKPDLARSLVALGRVKRTLGQVLPASELLMEGLDLFRALGQQLGIAEALEELGALSAVQGDGVQAAMLFGTAHALREGIGAPLHPWIAPPMILPSPPAAPSLARPPSPKPGHAQRPGRGKRWWIKSWSCARVSSQEASRCVAPTTGATHRRLVSALPAA